MATYPALNRTLKEKEMPCKVACSSASYEQLCYEYSKEELRLEKYKQIRSQQKKNAPGPFSETSMIMQVIRKN